MGLTKHSQFAIYSTVFLACTSFSIVLPTLWPYLKSLNATPNFLALVVATYSVGEGLGALLFTSALRSSSTRKTMTNVMITGVVGSIFYILPNQFCVLFGRLLHGVWTGAEQAVQQAYLADTLPFKSLTPTIVALNAFASLGFVFGPAFGFLTSIIPSFSLANGFLNVTELTSPGYAVLISSICCVLIYAFLFDETTDREGIVNEQLERDNLNPTNMDYNNDGNSENNTADELLPLLQPKSKGKVVEYSSVALIFCNVAFFVHFYAFAIQETVTTPLVQKLFNWNVRDANALFTAAGFLSLVVFGLLQLAANRIDDRSLLMISFGLGAIGFGLLSGGNNMTTSQFLVGFSFLSIAFPIGRATCVSLYTKLLPKSLQNIGQGVILAVGAAARIVGPFPAALTITSSFALVLVFGSAALAFLLSAALQVTLFERLAT